MSGPLNDGGPAFPSAALDERKMEAAWLGMTLRDYFAGQALAGIIADSSHDGEVDDVVEYAYAVADAMLAARAWGAK